MPESFSVQQDSLLDESTARGSIEVEHLVKRYGTVLAVDDVSLHIRHGEFVSLVGPSGAGKTSVLRMLAGFETPDAGSLTIGGRAMVGVPPNRRPVNLVFQSYALFPHLRVAENVAFGLEMRGVSRREIGERVLAMLTMVKLAGKEERWPHELSGGEQQRVALARALVNRPAVLLLDEPLSALDQQLRQHMQSELKAIQELVGITFVCVTHHQQEALAMSDRIAVMLAGRVAQIGAPREIYERPTSLAVARFIGDSNEISGKLEDVIDDSGFLVPISHAVARLRVCFRELIRRSGRATLSLRPEQLHVTREPCHDIDFNTVTGRIDKVLYGGHDIQYVVRVGDEVLWKVRRRTTGDDEKPFAPGEHIHLSWHAREGVLFPE